MQKSPQSDRVSSQRAELSGLLNSKCELRSTHIDTHERGFYSSQRRTLRKKMARKLFALLLLLLCSQAAGFAATGKPDWRAEWDKTVAAAEKEGLVSIYVFEN